MLIPKEAKIALIVATHLIAFWLGGQVEQNGWLKDQAKENVAVIEEAGRVVEVHNEIETEIVEGRNDVERVVESANDSLSDIESDPAIPPGACAAGSIVRMYIKTIGTQPAELYVLKSAEVSG